MPSFEGGGLLRSPGEGIHEGEDTRARAGTAALAPRGRDRGGRRVARCGCGGGAAHELRLGQATKVYIVQLAAKPAAGYTGGVSDLAATRPAKGHKIDARAANVVRYRSYLKTRHDAVAAKVGGVQRLYDYTLVFNGFSARMTEAQAAKLAHSDGVISVTADEQRTADTITTPEFLGLSAPGGLWEQLGGPGRRGAGRGIVIGVIDSGIWPESASFAPLVQPGKLAGWQGTCTTGQDFNASDCSNKLIGARFYDAGQGGDAAIPSEVPARVRLPVTTTATAPTPPAPPRGNNGVDGGPINGITLGKVSGMAPRAPGSPPTRSAVERRRSTATGSTSDLVAAIDDAVADGVDVINYSISGAAGDRRRPGRDRVPRRRQRRRLRRRLGRQQRPWGQDRRTQQPVGDHGGRRHPRPRLEDTVTLGNGATYTGPRSASTAVAAPARRLRNAAARRRDPTTAGLCSRAPAAPASTRPRSPARSWSAPAAPTTASTRAWRSSRPAASAWCSPTRRRTSLNADFHSVPTVHVDDTTGAAIKAYAARHGATRPRPRRGTRARRRGPEVAGFSSRGPALAGGGDLLKPDIIAPGVDVLAAVAPPATTGRTSTSSPAPRCRARTSRASPRCIKQRAPGLDADGDQVGHDDQRVDDRQRGQPDHHRLGRPRGPARLRLR